MFTPGKAHIHPTAEIEAGVIIGENTFIDKGVKIGTGTKIGRNCCIFKNTVIGKNNMFYTGCMVGLDPQDFKYTGEDTFLDIGDENQFREHVSLSRGSTKGIGTTRVGSGNFIMINAHVGHDVQIGNNVIIGNAVLLGGHVAIADGANLSGGCAVHQFARVGKYAFIGGLTRIVQDVPPFVIAEGHPSRVRSINVIGLRRNGFSPERVKLLKEVYKYIWKKGIPMSVSLKKLEEQYKDNEDVMMVVNFLKESCKGKFGRAKQP